MNRIIFGFIIILFFSCSKNNLSSVTNKTNSDNEQIEVTNSLENDLEGNLDVIKIYNSSQDKMTVMLDFINYPFIDKDIIYPDRIYYKSFEEIFTNLGHPINEMQQPIKNKQSEGNDAREFVYDLYKIYTIYLTFKDEVYIYSIKITMQDDIMYKFNLMKNDGPDKIREIFGWPYKTYEEKNNIEFLYSVPFNAETIGFQFIDDKLTAIMFYFNT